MFKPRIQIAQQTPEEAAAAERELQQIREAAKIGWKRNQEALKQLREQQRIDEETERQRTATVLPSSAVTEYDISKGLSIKNGVVQPQPEIPLSQGAIRTQQLAESFASIRNRK